MALFMRFLVSIDFPFDRELSAVVVPSDPLHDPAVGDACQEVSCPPDLHLAWVAINAQVAE
jgi:hypothetical protein